MVGLLQQSLYEDPKSGALQRTIPRRGADPLRSLTYPSQPVGYDRLGNAYWILTVQEATTLFPYQPNGVAILIGGSSSSSTAGDNKTPLEPCVLVREPSGWWGYHSGHELPALLSSFSSEIICERVLLLKMIEKLAYTRCHLHRNVLNIRVLQREWIIKRIRGEYWTQTAKYPTENVTPVQLNRLLELVWARCVEVRHQLHYASVYKYEDDAPINNSRAEKDAMMRKQKKMRESTLDDTFELHPLKGWDRSDMFARIRQTSACTTATRLVADPTIYPTLHQLLKRSPYLARNEPLAPPSTVQRGPMLALTASDTEQAPAVDTTAPAAAPAQEERSVAMEVCEPAPAEAVVAPAAGVQGKGETPVVEETAAAPEIANKAPEVVESAPAAADTAMEVEVDAPVSTPAVVEESSASAVSVAAPSDIVIATGDDDKKPTEAAANTQPSPGATSTQPTAAPATTAKEGAKEEGEEALDPSALIPNVRELIQQHSGPDGQRTKAIELLHLVTGQIVRIFPSGKDAAQFFGVSQSGISLCLHNTKPDYLGFRWRVYDGPPILCKRLFLFCLFCFVLCFTYILKIFFYFIFPS